MCDNAQFVRIPQGDTHAAIVKEPIHTHTHTYTHTQTHTHTHTHTHTQAAIAKEPKYCKELTSRGLVRLE